MRKGPKQTDGQIMYERAAGADTSRTYWREWRDLRPEEQAHWERLAGAPFHKPADMPDVEWAYELKIALDLKAGHFPP